MLGLIEVVISREREQIGRVAKSLRLIARRSEGGHTISEWVRDMADALDPDLDAAVDSQMEVDETAKQFAEQIAAIRRSNQLLNELSEAIAEVGD